MILIKNINITDFRSIQNGNIRINHGYLPIIGENNSGKSNILRALNLFFNDEVEPGLPLSLATDFHNPSRRRKKEISITVTFSLPDYFKFHKKIKDGLDNLIGRDFTIRKIWSYSAEELPAGLVTRFELQRGDQPFQTALGEESSRIQQFLNLIKFRYQPNHIHPSKVLKSEEPELQRALLSRLKRQKGTKSNEYEAIFGKIGLVASELIKPISTNLSKASGQVEDLELSTPQEFGELLFSFSPRLSVQGGDKFDALQHGSGVQSYLTYLMLKFLDTRYDLKFGWQQATVWALEEPESFLHQSLQHKFSEFLAETGESERFQIFCTTHSDVFIRYGQEGIMCQLHNAKTDWDILPSQGLISNTAKEGITPYIHPLLYSHRPLLLVEGETDRRYLKLAYRLLSRLNPWIIRDISSLDPEVNLQGIDGLRTYLQANLGAFKTRPLESPVFILVDWSVSKTKINQLEKEVRHHETSAIIKWEEEECNHDLDQSFTGIERALSVGLIQEAEDKGLLRTRRPSDSDTPLNLIRNSLNKKGLLNLAEQRQEADDFTHFKTIFNRLDKKLMESLEKAEKMIEGKLF